MFKRSAIILAISLTLFPVSRQAVEINKIELPDMGDSSGTLISPAEENEFGEEFFRSLHSQITINEDAEIQEYIQSIGRKLAANSDNPGHPFHFFVVMENDINAFAGPGGYIGINSGLILMTEAESELASVIAHEISHITQRHLFRAAEASSRLSIPTAAGMLGAILLGTRSAAMGQAAIMAIMGGSVQFQINFTRENEAEADRVGMQTLAATHFDPRSMPTFFERLQQATRYAGQSVPEFLRTHPVTESRISDTRGRAETYPYKQYPDSLAYQLTKAKIRILTTADPIFLEQYCRSKLNQGTLEQRTVAVYGLGLFLLKTEKFKDAEAIFQGLTKQYPEQPQYSSALAKIALDAKDFNMAVLRYQKLTEQFPDNSAIKLEYINALLKVDKADLARKHLLALSPEAPQMTIYLGLLAEAYNKINQPAESHRYLAEYYFAMGQTKDAIYQIRIALESKGLSFQLSSILSERLNFFLNQEQEAKANRQ
jgi:beta-barrel assembly-enhancing protease